MATNVKKVNFFQKMSNKYESAKSKVKGIVDKEKAAYNLGYNSALRDYATLPKVAGAKRFAISGYSKGMSYSHKANKYKNKINRKEK